MKPLFKKEDSQQFNYELEIGDVGMGQEMAREVERRI